MRKKIKELRERAKALKGQGGFTLVELMIVLVILVLIIAVAIPVMGNIMSNAEDSSYESSVGMIEKAAEVAYSDAKLQGNPADAKETYTVNELRTAGFLDLDVPATYGDKEIDGTERVTRDASGGSFTYAKSQDEPASE